MTKSAVAIAEPAAVAPTSLVRRMAGRFGVDDDKLLATLKATAFRQAKDDPPVTNEQMMALLVVADQYKLNPFTRELFAFPDKHNGIVPVVSVDGWARIINEHPQFDGVAFAYGDASQLGAHKGAPEWIECSVYRKDRTRPVVIRERLAECFRSTGPWQSHPSRMLRHKSLIQCARLAFGFAGIYDEDEAQRIVEGVVATRVVESAPAIAAINESIRKPAQTVDVTTLAGQTETLGHIAYADVRAALDRAAGDDEAFNSALDLIRFVADEGQRAELRAYAETLNQPNGATA